MKYKASSKFLRSLKKLEGKEKGVLTSKVEQKLQLLTNNPQHKSLRLHKITSTKGDAWSISIDMSVRLLFVYIDGEILLVDIGTHDEIY